MFFLDCVLIIKVCFIINQVFFYDMTIQYFYFFFKKRSHILFLAEEFVWKPTVLQPHCKKKLVIVTLYLTLFLIITISYFITHIFKLSRSMTFFLSFTPRRKQTCYGNFIFVFTLQTAISHVNENLI